MLFYLIIIIEINFIKKIKEKTFGRALFAVQYSFYERSTTAQLISDVRWSMRRSGEEEEKGGMDVIALQLLPLLGGTCRALPTEQRWWWWWWLKVTGKGASAAIAIHQRGTKGDKTPLLVCGRSPKQS